MIEIIKIPEIKDEVIFISGFTGTGNVGLLAAKILAEKIKGELVAKIYSFDFPPFSIIEGKEVDFPSVKIFNKNNIFVAYSEFQPSLSFFQYKLSKELINFTKKFKVKYFISLGAMIIDFLNENPEVYFYTNSSEIEKSLKELNLKNDRQFSTIIGCNGLNYAFSVKSGYKSSLILVDTYKFFENDYGGCKKLLEVLSKFLNLEIDLSDLEKIVENQRKEYKKLVKSFTAEKKEERETLSYIG